MSFEKIEKIDEIIEELNAIIWEQIEHEEVSISMYSCGWGIAIKFLDIEIWNSENDEREYIDEENDIHEDFREYLIRRINEELEIIKVLEIC